MKFDTHLTVDAQIAISIVVESVGKKRKRFSDSIESR